MILLDQSNPHSRFPFGCTCVEYHIEGDQTVSFTILPAERLADRVPKRVNLEAPEVTRLPARFLPLPARTPDSLVQLHVRGEGVDLSPPSGFGQGLTMRGGEASSALKFKSQEIHRIRHGHHRGDNP